MHPLAFEDWLTRKFGAKSPPSRRHLATKPPRPKKKQIAEWVTLALSMFDPDETPVVQIGSSTWRAYYEDGVACGYAWNGHVHEDWMAGEVVRWRSMMAGQNSPWQKLNPGQKHPVTGRQIRSGNAWFNSQTKQTKYQKTQPGSRPRGKPAPGAARAALSLLEDGPEAFKTPEARVQAFKDLIADDGIPSLTMEQLRKFRTVLQKKFGVKTGFGGETRKAGMVAAFQKDVQAKEKQILEAVKGWREGQSPAAATTPTEDQIHKNPGIAEKENRSQRERSAEDMKKQLRDMPEELKGKMDTPPEVRDEEGNVVVPEGEESKETLTPEQQQALESMALTSRPDPQKERVPLIRSVGDVLKARPNEPVSVDEIAEAIHAKTGIKVSTNEILNEAIDLKSKLDSKTRKLQAKVQGLKMVGATKQLAQAQKELDRHEAKRMTLRTAFKGGKRALVFVGKPTQAQQAKQEAAEKRQQNPDTFDLGQWTPTDKNYTPVIDHLKKTGQWISQNDFAQAAGFDTKVGGEGKGGDVGMLLNVIAHLGEKDGAVEFRNNPDGGYQFKINDADAAKAAVAQAERARSAKQKTAEDEINEGDMGQAAEESRRTQPEPTPQPQPQAQPQSKPEPRPQAATEKPKPTVDVPERFKEMIGNTKAAEGLDPGEVWTKASRLAKIDGRAEPNPSYIQSAAVQLKKAANAKPEAKPEPKPESRPLAATDKPKPTMPASIGDVWDDHLHVDGDTDEESLSDEFHQVAMNKNNKSGTIRKVFQYATGHAAPEGVTSRKGLLAAFKEAVVLKRQSS